MRIGIGLPAAVPGTDMTTLGHWAADSERAGFAAVGVIDRLVYDNLDPLTTLAVAAARTERVELLTTVLSVGWRNNPILLAKQIASVEQISGGRLTAGLGLGGWPEDFTASRVPLAGQAALWESTLTAMRQVWAGKVSGQGGRLADMDDAARPAAREHPRLRRHAHGRRPRHERGRPAGDVTRGAQPRHHRRLDLADHRWAEPDRDRAGARLADGRPPRPKLGDDRELRAIHEAVLDRACVTSYVHRSSNPWS
jgi:alkanesulfonate monooxygenase SsuD/methylene tetrahydromethanopterin reductase-like flavin-dependent oxidoreductase (luciferase family)